MVYNSGSESDMMMVGFLAFASCRGPDGRGGTQEMYNYNMVVPDISYRALQTRKAQLIGVGTSHLASGNAWEYNLQDLRMEVSHGQRPDGSSLVRYMPRGEISDQDLADLLDFLKTLT